VGGAVKQVLVSGYPKIGNHSNTAGIRQREHGGSHQLLKGPRLWGKRNWSEKKAFKEIGENKGRAFASVKIVKVV